MAGEVVIHAITSLRGGDGATTPVPTDAGQEYSAP
jgi:hypothetical protein